MKTVDTSTRVMIKGYFNGRQTSRTLSVIDCDDPEQIYQLCAKLKTDPKWEDTLRFRVYIDSTARSYDTNLSLEDFTFRLRNLINGATK